MININRWKILIIAICTIVILSLAIFFVYFHNLNESKTSIPTISSISIDNIADIIQENKAKLTKYYIYGTHFNLFATLDNVVFEDVNDLKPYLILKSNGNEIIKNVIFTYSNNTLKFNLSNEINMGINLEELLAEKYYLLLCVENTKTNEYNYYTFENTTEYNNLEYYTLSTNKNCNKINLIFDSDITYIEGSVLVNQNEDIYDIVIDAGHGGKDTGAINGNYYESDYTYKISLELKEKLESLGLKVKLTRENIEDRPKEYGDNGRATLPNKTKSKFLFSIHLNSCEKGLGYNGVEVYRATKCNNDFATLLADNIVKYANTNYSNKDLEKYSNGVYTRNFTEEDIKSMDDDAKKGNYEPYNITTDTPYYFIIRESGGMVTSAYVDGRNKDLEKNDFYNSNSVVEAYLLELGYINNDKDLQNILNNQSGYVEGIYQTILSIL